MYGGVRLVPREVVAIFLGHEVDEPHGLNLDPLAPELDVQRVLFPEGPVFRLHVQSCHWGVMADLLGQGTVLALLVHQLVGLAKERVKGLAIPFLEMGRRGGVVRGERRGGEGGEEGW